MITRADNAAPTRQEIEARLDDFYAAWQVRDGVSMRAMFGGGDRLLVWGARRDERIEGRAEADLEFDRWVEACPPWTSLEVTRRDVGARGGSAWAAEEVTGKWSHEDKSGAEHFRITTVWEEDDGWKLVHVHMDLLERFSKRLTFRKPCISSSRSGSGGSLEVIPRPVDGIIHFEKRCK